MTAEELALVEAEADFAAAEARLRVIRERVAASTLPKRPAPKRASVTPPEHTDELAKADGRKALQHARLELDRTRELRGEPLEARLLAELLRKLVTPASFSRAPSRKLRSR